MFLNVLPLASSITILSSNDIDLQKAKIIAYDIRNSINGNPYANNVRGTKRILKSTYPNNNKTNENRNMKQTIRLTESDLRNIIMEAINELEPQTYASYAKNVPNKVNWIKPRSGSKKQFPHSTLNTVQINPMVVLVWYLTGNMTRTAMM